MFGKLFRGRSKKTAQDFINLASQQMERGRVTEALEFIEQALVLEPTNSQALLIKGCTYSQREQHTKALSCFQMSAENAGDKVSVPLYHMGNALQALGRHNEAVLSYTKALQSDPSIAGAWLNLGQLVDDAGDHKQAVNYYDKALQLEPRDDTAWANRGNSLRALGQFEGALASYRKALQLNENNLPAQVGNAACLAMTGDLEEGLKIIDRVLSGGEQPEALHQKAILLGLQARYSDALIFADKSIELGIDSPEAWNHRGELLAKLNRTEEAIDSFDSALSRSNNCTAAWFGKARLLYDIGKPQESRCAMINYFAYANGTGDLQDAVGALCALLDQVEVARPVMSSTQHHGRTVRSGNAH